MKKSLVKMLGVVAVTWTIHSSAAGIGSIDVLSALGAPLNANIELVTVNKDEKSSLVVRLASQDAYKTAGLDYPFNNKFKLTIENRADGSSYIHATSQQPINDPFVSLMVELKWSSGRVLRQYTFLLDPPGYQAEQAAPTQVQPVAPVAAPTPVSVQPIVAPAPAVSEPAPVVSNPTPVATEAAALTPIEPEPEQPAAEAKPVKGKAGVPKSKSQKVATEKPVATGDIKVQRGDTLNKIAAANKIDGVSLERMIVALYRANADQFDGKNMNRIKTGKVLHRPDEKELDALTQSDAKKEIRAQVSDWNAYRQRLASAAPASGKQQAPQQTSAGKISSTVADKTPPVKEAAKEVLKLSKGDAPTDKAAAAKTSGQDKKNAAQEDAIAKAKAAEDERARQALLEKNLQDMKHLAELKTQAAALAQPASAPVSAVVAAVPASQASAASTVEAVSAAVAASPVAAASAPKPVAKPVVKPTVAEGPSLIDQFLAEPMYLGGAAAALLGLGGLVIAARRRKSKPAAVKSAESDLSSTAAHIAAPEIPSPDTGDFTVQASQTQMLAPLATDDDPISEAELFLSFGRDVQAEEILQDALQSAADKTPVRMKLLEIYAARKDNAAFEDIATQVKFSGDDNAWKKAEAMGRKFDPQNPLYGGATQLEDSDSATMQTAAMSARPDFASKTASRTVSAPSSFESDMGTTSKPDMGATGKMMVEMESSVSASNPVMDFDLSALHTETKAPADSSQNPYASPDDLVFDITATHPSMPAAQESALAEKPADDGMPFMMDFKLDTTEPVAAPAKAPEFDLSEINLNLGDDFSAKADAGSEQWHEVATKLDLARAYQEMTDYAGAREILNEVLQEGDAEQRAAAQEIMKQLG